MFHKTDSGSELGTTKASINRTRKTNASAGPKRRYNEYKDFHQCELGGHICAAFLEMSEMAKEDGIAIFFNKLALLFFLNEKIFTYLYPFSILLIIVMNSTFNIFPICQPKFCCYVRSLPLISCKYMFIFF